MGGGAPIVLIGRRCECIILLIRGCEERSKRLLFSSFFFVSHLAFSFSRLGMGLCPSCCWSYDTEYRNEQMSNSTLRNIYTKYSLAYRTYRWCSIRSNKCCMVIKIAIPKWIIINNHINRKMEFFFGENKWTTNICRSGHFHGLVSEHVRHSSTNVTYQKFDNTMIEQTETK